MKDAIPLLTPVAHAALRVVSGGMFTFHGIQKILGWLSKNPPSDPLTQIWFGGLIELFCGLLIAAGLLTRPAAFLSSGTMAVAYIQYHWKFDWAAFQWVPGVNRSELAVLYCFVFLLIFAYGPGPFALDPYVRILRRKKPPGE